MSRGRFLVWAGLILLAALVFRVQHARSRNGLWRDEAQGFAIVQESRSVPEMLAKLEFEGHPPAPYLVRYLLQHRFSLDPEELRIVPISSGILMILLVIALGNRLFGPHNGLLSGLLVATGPFFIYYATELRSYSLFGVFVLLHAFAYVRYLRRPTYATAVVWGASIAAMAYVHYYALHVAIGAGLYALLRQRTRENALRVGAAALAAIVLFAPWLPSFFAQLGHDLQPWWKPKTTFPRAFDIIVTPLGAWGGFIVAWGLLASVQALRRDRPDAWRVRAFRGLLAASLGAAFIAWIVQFWKSPYWPRYLLGMIAAMMPLVCYAWARMFQRPHPRPAIATAILVVALLFQMTSPERWLRRTVSGSQEIAARVMEHERPTDAIWIAPAFFAPPFIHHYKGDLPIRVPPYRGRLTHVNWVDIARKEQDIDLLLGFYEELKNHLANGNRVWFVLDGYFPLEREWVFKSTRSVGNDPPIVRYEHQIVRRLLRILYRNAEDVHQYDTPVYHYHENVTLILFDPAAKTK